MLLPLKPTPQDYLTYDTAALSRTVPPDKAELDAYLRNIECHPYYAKMAAVKAISMLHVDVLMVLRLLARSMRGGILEIGPYIGGSSLALGSGVRDGGGSPYVSIEHGGINEELGGNYRDHPFYPSSNILADLRKNLAGEGLLDFVTIVEGKSSDPAVVKQIFDVFKERKIELLFIDADGAVDRDMDLFRPLLAPNCILVFDDYTAPGAVDKEQRVRAAVDRQIDRGCFENYGVFGWGTWIGQYVG